MSENNKKFLQEAEAFFADNKNVNVARLYITSDGNLFRAEHYADNWKTELTDKTIEVFDRPENGNTSSLDEIDQTTEVVTSVTSKSDGVREDLVKQYIELYDTKPSHFMGLEKLQDKITAKRLELAKEPAEDTSQKDSSSLDTEDNPASENK